MQSNRTTVRTHMIEFCADMKEDEISVFDKAYITFSHLHTLHWSAIFWVTRAKDNLNYEIVKPLDIGNKKRIPKQVDESENTKKQTQKEKRQNNQYQVILKDIAIRLTTPAS